MPDPEADRLRIAAERAYTMNGADVAYEVFSALVRRYPTDKKINFGYGMVCMELKLYSHAMLAFERVLEVSPNYGPARLQLAKIRILNKQFVTARKELLTLKAQNPPAEMLKTINKTLAELTEIEKSWSFSSRVDFGAFYDDNINVGPKSDSIVIEPIVLGSSSIDVLTVNEESQPIGAEGFMATLSVNGMRDVGERGNWISYGNFSIFKNWIPDYSQNETDFTQVLYGVRKAEGKVMMQAPVKLAYIRYASEALMTQVGVDPSYIKIIGESNDKRIISKVSLEWHDYDYLNGRDGIYLGLSEGIVKTIGEKRHVVSAKASLYSDFTDDSSYEYIGFRLDVDGRYNTKLGPVGYARVKYSESDYKNREVLSPVDREDHMMQFTIGGSHVFKNGAGLDLSYNLTDNDSTFKLYQYDRSVIMLTTFYAF